MGFCLPHDALYEIFEHLDIDDLLNVSLTCRLFNEASTALVYNKLYLTWSDIDDIAAMAPKDDIRLAVVNKVHIAANGRGEWTSSPKLPALVGLSHGRLNELEIKCALRSSGWFKYISEPLITIRRLTLSNNGSFQNYSFDFAHVANTIPNVEEIMLGDSLGGFMIDPFADGGFKRLRRIRLENCEWQYPACISDAAEYGELESLELLFTQPMHPFAFSERLKSEFRHIPDSLKNLEVYIDVGKRISWNPLQRSKPLKNLERALLHGFEYKYQLNRKPSSMSKFPKLKEIIEK